MYRALESFSGLISMYKGEEKVIDNQDIIDDLIRANYIEEVKPIEPVDIAKPDKKTKTGDVE